MTRNSAARYSLSSLDRCRWNVLDLITFVARNSVPTYILCDIDMSWAEKIRQEYASRGGQLTVTALLLKAIGLAQQKRPETRTAILPLGRFVTFEDIVAGFTVEKLVDGKPSVFFGTIKAPHTKPLCEIVSELRSFSVAEIDEHPQLSLQLKFSKMSWIVRRLILWVASLCPRLRLQAMAATFGLSSLGKYGISAVTGPAVCASMFGVGAVKDRPVAHHGRLEIHPVMTLSLSFDHRLIDGADAARFLSEVKSLMEGGLKKYLDENAPATECESGSPVLSLQN